MERDDILLIALATLVVAGYGYSMDMPQALEVPLREPPFNFTSMEFNLLYVFTYLPIIFTDIPIGVLLDKFPLQRTVIIITLIGFLSQIITAFLFQFQPFGRGYIYIVYVMRAFDGMSGSSAFTIQGLLLTIYAKEYYEMLSGIALCIPFVFDSINLSISPYIEETSGSMGLPWFIACAIDFLSLLFSFAIAYLTIKKIRIARE